jgi:hypothetical protein
MKYQAIEELRQAEVEAAIARNEPSELSLAVLSAALYAEDAAWAEDVCVRLAGHAHERVRGNAVLGFGHMARLHRRLDEQRVKPLIAAALQDESAYVRGQAEAAAEDVEVFLQWRLTSQR